MKAMFLCCYTPQIAYYAKPVVDLNRRYCERHGHELVCETDEAKINRGCRDRSNFWYYFKMLEQHWGEKGIDWFVKLDCDAAIVNHAFDLRTWTDGDADIIWATDYGPDVMNAGIQLIRNADCCRDFYRRAWDAAEHLARGIYKTAIFHEQTVLSAAYLLKGPGRPNIKIVPHSETDSFDCFYEDRINKAFIFHDIGKKKLRHLGPSSANPLRYEVKKGPVLEMAGGETAPENPMKDAPVAVVYYAFLAPGWQKTVAEQLGRLKKSGLYDAAKIIYMVCTDPGDKAKTELAEMLGPYEKIQMSRGTKNTWEYPGIMKVQEISETGKFKVLYFHTKDVTSQESTSTPGWRQFMESCLIDKWQDCVRGLDSHDLVVPVYREGADRVPGNFWWATSPYLQTCEAVIGSDKDYYQTWVTRGRKFTFQEIRHLGFDLGASDFPAWLYDGSRDLSNDRLVIRRAVYAPTTPQKQKDGTPAENDVTSILAAAIECAGGRRIDVTVYNENMGGDPIFGFPKALQIWWTVSSEPDAEHYLRVPEGAPLFLELP
jgi:hypothetical protein